MIVTPTAGKEDTTISINGMIALAYGQGSYTNYFYTVGTALRDLTASFTVNGESYIDVDGKAFCNTSDFEFVANPDTLTNLVWMPEANTAGSDDEKQNWNNPKNWTTTYTSFTEKVTQSATDGFAFYMYGYDKSGDATRNLGCEETGFFSDPAYNDLTYLPAIRSGESYGIEKTNGIFELPFFSDSTSLYSHRTQVYNSNGSSTFYAVNDGGLNIADFNKLIGTSVSVPRESDEGNYRFAPETYNPVKGEWEFQTTLTCPVSGLNDGDEFLAGNPYMSSIDMVEFYKDNLSTINPMFRIWNGDVFDDYGIDVETGEIVPTNPQHTNRYIAPLQGFILTSTGALGDVRFDVSRISTVRPAGTSFNLISAVGDDEENTLRIKAENSRSASYAVIKYKEGAYNGFIKGMDVQKLFSRNSYVPEVYSLAGTTPASIQFTGSSNEMVIPLGIKTGQAGEIRLTFTGMDNYLEATRIELVDMIAGRAIDLTGMPSYTYTFNHTETGTQNRRFTLRISNSMTGIQEAGETDNLKVFGDSNGVYVVTSTSDPVEEVIVYDFQGRKLYESRSGASYYPLDGQAASTPLIVKVNTRFQSKTVKLNLTNN